MSSRSNCREDLLYQVDAGPAGGRLRRPSSAGKTPIDGRRRCIDDACMPSMNRRLTSWAEADPIGIALISGFVAGLLAFLLGLLALGDRVWTLVIIASVATGGATYSKSPPPVLVP
jgi:hypothetical protein